MHQHLYSITSKVKLKIKDEDSTETHKTEVYQLTYPITNSFIAKIIVNLPDELKYSLIKNDGVFEEDIENISVEIVNINFLHMVEV